ncbi:hypothetical protein [Mucilaginibacter sp.]
MATQHTKRIGVKPAKETKNGTYLTKENWEVMKPFVHFAFKAIAVIGSVMFAIVKMIPKALEHKPEERKNDKIIKI